MSGELRLSIRANFESVYDTKWLLSSAHNLNVSINLLKLILYNIIDKQYQRKHSPMNCAFVAFGDKYRVFVICISKYRSN